MTARVEGAHESMKQRMDGLKYEYTLQRRSRNESETNIPEMFDLF